MFKNVEDRFVYLSNCNGVGKKQLTEWMKNDRLSESMFTMNSVQIKNHYNINEETARTILDVRNQERFLKQFEEYSSKGIEIIPIFNDDYPPLLREIYDPPVVLYAKGDRKLMTSALLLSVVGTRYPSQNGEQSLRKIISPLVQSGWTIVSGLAYGIDVYSHKQAIEQSGKTIAVLGSGFNQIYPKEHLEIANEIAMDHLLLSEYPPDRKPAKWQFPLRNRIISGLSRGTLIIEARERSGSLITGDQALQQGREVFAVPGSIMEPRSAGTNHLIQQGAKLTTCAEDIVDELSHFTATV